MSSHFRRFICTIAALLFFPALLSAQAWYTYGNWNVASSGSSLTPGTNVTSNGGVVLYGPSTQSRVTADGPQGFSVVFNTSYPFQDATVVTGNLSYAPTTAGIYTLRAEMFGASGELLYSNVVTVFSVGGPENNSTALPASIYNGQSITLTRAGTAPSGVAWVENTIWRPDGSSESLGNYYAPAAFGQMSYTPSSGTGTYYYQSRVVDSYSNYQDRTVSFTVLANNPPTASLSASATTVALGQTITFTSVSSDPENALAFHSIWWDQGSGLYWSNAQFDWSYPATGGYTISNSNGATPATGQTITASFRAMAVASYQFLGAAEDSLGAWGETQLGVTVVKATPAVTFASRTIPAPSGATYTLTAADLNAALANPYSSGVTQPNGSSVTYRIAGSNTAITAGSQLARGYTYSIEAVYAGDGNYNAGLLAATFTIAGVSAPTSLQATSIGSTLVSFSWQASVSPAGINHYEIYRDGSYLNQVGGSTLTFTDTAITPLSVHTYFVRAIDNGSNISANSSTLSITGAAPFELFTPLP